MGIADTRKIITALREKHNLTQLELSKKAKISNATISDIEAGKVMPSNITLEKIADVFGMDLAEFLKLIPDDVGKTEIVEISDEDTEIKRWARDPSNFDYIKFAYNISLRGVSKELLKNLDVIIKF